MALVSSVQREKLSNAIHSRMNGLLDKDSPYRALIDGIVSCVITEGWVPPEVNKAREAAAEEWHLITTIPSGNFEINQAGDIRHRHTKVIIEPRYYTTPGIVCVQLVINTLPYWINGPKLAEDMWTPAKRADS